MFEEEEICGEVVVRPTVRRVLGRRGKRQAKGRERGERARGARETEERGRKEGGKREERKGKERGKRGEREGKERGKRGEREGGNQTLERASNTETEARPLNPYPHRNPVGATASHPTLSSPSRQRDCVPVIGQPSIRIDAATATHRCDGPYTPSGACTSHC